MAMIVCPHCGEHVSEKAKKCVHCGAILIPEEKQHCMECGAELEEGMTECPNCGCPVDDTLGLETDEKPQKVEVTGVKVTKKIKVIIGIVVALFVVGGTTAFGVTQYQKKKAAEEYAQQVEEYYGNLELATYTMLTGASEAESAGNLIKQVWYNAIYEEKDDDTDNYTRPEGSFVSDFNEALGNLFTDKQSILEDGKILRFGYVRDDELSQNPYATSFNYALSKCDSYARQLEHLMAKRDELRAKNQMKSKEYDEVEHKIKEIRGEIRKEERKYVERAQVIGTTISRATIDPMFEERQFDLVMFDEVSMAYVPQVIAAAALAKEKFMCVGDFRQLAPISQSPDSRVLQVDIFSYLQIVDGKENMYWHPWLVMLNEQRRMAPAISEFPSKFIYNRLLKDNAEVINGKKKKDNDLVIKSAPLPGDALNLIDLAGTYCAADKNTDGSRFNILSAVISFSTAVKAEQNHIKTVGIITPYAAQVRLIRAMLKDYYTKGTTNVSCATVHQFQGSESDVIVFDAVESYPKSAVGYLMGKEPNQVARLINVAITRGKGKVITVANARFWENVFKGTNHIFYKLLQHIKNGKHQVIDNHDKTLQPYIESVNPGRMINIFMNEQDAISMFEQDMKKAKWQAVVSLPSGELRETEHQVFEILDEADSRGIDIKMKSNDYAKLPEQWKKYCVGTENATFPLIIIDDEVVWYGLPTAKWKFQVDKTTSMITVVHSMVRIKGKNTVEMIKALTDIETVIVGQNIRKLDNKKSKLVTNSFAASSGNLEDNGSILNYGLGAFVEEKEFCSKCKNHMILAKNARGTAYLKCSNKACKETKYLTVDLMNWYINSHNIKCPKRDGGELKGGLGKYGPYVRCNCGHFLKPDEI